MKAKEVKAYAREVFQEHVDNLGQINLTRLEEDVADHFHVTLDDWIVLDSISWWVWQAMEEDGRV